jgi:AraC family transcriptional regulator, arabinose operon regulatory protein
MKLMKINTVWPVITEKESTLPFILTSIGISDNQEHVLRPLGHEDFHWLHCTTGKGKLIIEGKEAIIEVNDGFFFYPGVSHEYYAIEEPWVTNYITFNGNSISLILELLEIPKWGVFSFNDLLPLEKIMQEISYTVITSNPLKAFLSSNLVFRFIIQLKESISLGKPRKSQSKFYQLQPVINHIEKFFYTNLSLDELANIINVTPQHLCRVFKHTFKMRPFEYLTLFRIQKAKEILDTPSKLSISDVGRMVGFSDASYFCHIFKQHEGRSPFEFKTRYSAE